MNSDVAFALSQHLERSGQMRKWLWLEGPEAITTHDRLMILHGGITGLRDRELLLALLARQQHLNTYNKGVDAATLAAAYTFAIVKNHPFADGNKRTGFVLEQIPFTLHSHNV